MESENGITLDDGSGFVDKCHMEGSVPHDGKIASEVDGSSVLVTQDEGPNLSGVTGEASVTVAESKTSKSSKEPRSGTIGSLKNNKVAKDQPNAKGPTLCSRKQRSLSQSLSFPSRGTRADGMKKSVDGHPVKSDAKNSRPNGSQVPFSNGSVTSATRLSHPNKRVSTGVNTTEANRNTGGASLRRTTIASTSRIQQPVCGKSGSVQAMDCAPPSEISLSADQNLKPSQNGLLIKEDDDVRSTSSSTGQRRSSVSGFAFRLDERAEKRKEFFSKLEEKISAKEVEKTNMQEKSKENQEAEIKQLRKSLTFKATPMPTFYKEPAQKAELKKIPTTRAISPKLGRHKGITVSTKSSSENGGFCASPRLNRDKSNSTKGIQANSDKEVGSKKLLRKSQSKLQSQQTANAKTEQKPVKSEPKTIEENQNAYAGEIKESQNPSVNLPEIENRIDLESEKDLDSAHDNGLILSSANLDIMPTEVSVGG